MRTQEELNNLLFKAVSEKNIRDIENALDGGADVNAKNQYEETPLIRAIPSGYGVTNEINEKVVKLLLKRRADVNAVDKNGKTPLHTASDLFKIESHFKIENMTTEQLIEYRSVMIRLLLDKNADINAKDKGGNTPLHLAAYFGADDVVKLLIERGANLDIENNSRKKPIEWTRDENIKEILNNAAAGGSRAEQSPAAGGSIEQQSPAARGSGVEQSQEAGSGIGSGAKQSQEAGGSSLFRRIFGQPSEKKGHATSFSSRAHQPDKNQRGSR